MKQDRLTHDEVTAIAMLVGDGLPIVCSCCFGRGRNPALFGGSTKCYQCDETGYDIVDKKTKEAINERWPRQLKPWPHFIG